MKKIFDFIKQNKIILYLLLIVVAFIANLFLKEDKPQIDTSPKIVTPNYKSIYPGKSTESELLQALGEVVSEKTEGNNRLPEKNSWQ